MKIVLSVICFIAIVWRSSVASAIIYDRIKSGVPSPILYIILWDSILVIIITACLLVKLW